MVGFVNVLPMMSLSTSTSTSGLPSETILRNVRIKQAAKERRLREDALQKQAEWAAELAALRSPSTLSTAVTGNGYARWDMRINSIVKRVTTPSTFSAIEEFIAKTPQRPTRADAAESTPDAVSSSAVEGGDAVVAEEEKAAEEETGGLSGIAKALGLNK